jgi:hypothetical protein
LICHMFDIKTYTLLLNGNGTNYRNLQSSFHILFTSQWRICFQQNPILFRPLPKYVITHLKISILILISTDLHKFGLRIPIIQLNLIHSRFDLEWVCSQVLNSTDIEAEGI